MGWGKGGGGRHNLRSDISLQFLLSSFPSPDSEAYSSPGGGGGKRDHLLSFPLPQLLDPDLQPLLGAEPHDGFPHGSLLSRGLFRSPGRLFCQGPPGRLRDGPVQLERLHILVLCTCYTRSKEPGFQSCNPILVLCTHYMRSEESRLEAVIPEMTIRFYTDALETCSAKVLV